MVLLFRSLLVLVTLLDAGAELCTAMVALVYGVAWTVSLPFVLAARGLIALSRRISHGSPHGHAP